MRRISLRSLQRRSPSHERRELSNHRHRSGREAQTRQQGSRECRSSQNPDPVYMILFLKLKTSWQTSTDPPLVFTFS